MDNKKILLNYIIFKNDLKGKVGDFNGNKVIIGHNSIRFFSEETLYLDNYITKDVITYTINGEERECFVIISDFKNNKSWIEENQ